MHGANEQTDALWNIGAGIYIFRVKQSKGFRRMPSKGMNSWLSANTPGDRQQPQECNWQLWFRAFALHARSAAGDHHDILPNGPSLRLGVNIENGGVLYILSKRSSLRLGVWRGGRVLPRSSAHNNNERMQCGMADTPCRAFSPAYRLVGF